MIKDFYILTKPGIIRGNLVTAAAGFLFASNGNITVSSLVFLLIGVSLIIASACAINNYTDRKIDSKMKRTKNRPFVIGSIKPLHGLLFAVLIGSAGFILLILKTNTLTVLLGLLAFVDYVILYGWSKRRSHHSTLIGTISGAIPITAGYTAYTNNFDIAALLLFLSLVFWQMSHFYAISIYRLQEYKSAKLPTLPLTLGVQETIKQINLYIFLFIIATGSLYVLGYTNLFYLLIMLAGGFWWLGIATQGFNTKNKKFWARSMFKVSLNILMIYSVLLSANSLL